MGKRIAVTGSTGLIGEALVAHLQDRGDRVHRVVRDPGAGSGGDLGWSPSSGEIDAQGFEGLDGVVHLAGAPIGPRLWTAAARREIMESRSRGTGLLATTLAGLDHPPPVLVSSSGINYYGHDRGDEILTEASPGPGDGFLADVCQVWEDSARSAAADGRIRVAVARTAPVLSLDGGLLKFASLPFKFGVGGRLGSGRQWLSWITLEDEVRALTYLLDHDAVDGPVNLSAPAPVTNAEFTAAMGEILHRPTLVPVPAAVLTGVLGDVAREMVLANLRVLPTVLEEHGFEFHHRDIRSGLRHALEV